jgi:hypothetical protein
LEGGEVKFLIRVGVALGVLLVLLFVGLALAVPRIVKSDAVRERAEAAAYDALGREVRYGGLDVGLLPPSLLVEEPRVAGASADEEPLLEAKVLALEVALLPLLTGTVLVDSLVIDGATLRVTRTPDGIQLPTPPAGEEPPVGERQPESPAEAESPEASAAAVSIALREVEVRDARVVLTDRAVTPETLWDVALDASARGSSLDDPIEVDATATLASGGAISVSGTATLSGDLDVGIGLDALALAALAPYLGEATRVDGTLDGLVEVRGPASNPAEVIAELSLSDGDVRAADAVLSGPVTITAEIANAVEKPEGPFSVDATAAALRYGDVFDKAAGIPATVTGRVVAGAGDTPAIDDLAVVLRNLEARGRVRLSPVRLDLSTNPVELAGWETLVSPLAANPLTGTLRVEKMVVRTEPMSLDGTIALANVVVEPEGQEPLSIGGAVDLSGDTAKTRDLVVRAADQPMEISALVEDLFGTPRYTVDLGTEGADVNALASAFAGKPDTLFGPLNLTGKVTGTVEPDRSPLETLDGTLDFDVTKGKLVGVSLLEATLSQLGAVGKIGSLAVDAGRVFGGRDLQRFYGDEFEQLRGTFKVRDGVVYSEPLSLVYPGYGAKLAGTIDLADLALDMKGTITLFEDVDASIAQGIGADDGYRPSRRQIPLAGVVGTLDDPKVRLGANEATRFVTAYAGDLYEDKLKRVVTDELGEGADAIVDEGLDVLRGILRR